MEWQLSLNHQEQPDEQSTHYISQKPGRAEHGLPLIIHGPMGVEPQVPELQCHSLNSAEDPGLKDEKDSDKEKGKKRKPRRVLRPPSVSNRSFKRSSGVRVHPHSPKQQRASANLSDCTARLDPFSALPGALNQFDDNLLRWYLFHYPRAQYGFHPDLNPHPVHTNFTISLSTPACFEVILARSALTQLNLKMYESSQKKRHLEQATLRHKEKALQLVQRSSSEYNKSESTKSKDDLLASIMSLGNLDRRAGARSADIHYTAIRRILKATGGPLNVASPTLRRVSLFFECMYGTSPISYVWDSSDFAPILDGLNSFLNEIWETRRSEPSMVDRDKDTHSGSDTPSPYIRPDSMLCAILSRAPIDLLHPDRQDHLNLIWQLTSALLLAALIVEAESNRSRSRSLMTSIYEAVEHGPPKLLVQDSITNVMWLLFQGVGGSPSSATTISEILWTEVDERMHSERILHVAGWVFVCKYLSFTMRLKVKTWIMHFLTGTFKAIPHDKESRPLKLTLFDFSYAC